MALQGICLQLTHTGVARVSLHLSDVVDGVDVLASFRKAGPIYVPLDETVLLSYTGSVAISFETGAIRGFIERGMLTAIFVLGPTFLAALPGGGGGSLQSAYEAGNSITTSLAEGNVLLAGTQDLIVTLSDVDMDVTGFLAFDAVGPISIGGDGDTGAISIGTGSGARTLIIGNANGATSVNVDTGTGGFDVDSLGVVSIGGADTTNLSMVASSASNKTLSISATNAGAGAGLITVTAEGSLSVESTGSSVDVQALGNLTLDSSVGSIGIGTDSNAGAINLGTSASARPITIGNNVGATSVLINSGTEFVQIDGVTYYGKSAGNPTPRTGGFQEGDHYFDTNLDMEMRYDSTRAKWLSVEAVPFYFGRNGNIAAAQFYFTNDGRVMSATAGFRAPYNGTIVGLGYTRSDSDAATFDVVEGGTSRATLASSAVTGHSNSLNGDFSQDGILAIQNQAGSNTTSDVIAWVKFRWRAT